MTTFTHLRRTRIAVPAGSTEDPRFEPNVRVVDLWLNEDTKRVHVTQDHGTDVISVMPRDEPDSGHWFGPRSDYGIGYVSSGYSRYYINRLERRAVEYLAAGRVPEE